ncbi:MAG: DMT family transporter [Caldilineales bacterium]
MSTQTNAPLVAPVSARPPIRAYALLGVGIVCIGLSAIWVKWADLPGLVSAFYRVFIASVVLVPWWLMSRRKLPRRRALALTGLGGVFFALDLALWNTALLITSAAQATLLANNAPLWVGLGALLIFREKLPRLYWIGLVLAMAGMALVARPAGAQGLAFDAGSLLALGASLLYAAYLLSTQRVRGSTDTLTFMTVSVVSSATLLLVICLLTGATLTGFAATTWLALLGLGLISQLGGWLSINFVLGVLPATQVSVSLLGQVIVTTVLAAIIFGEMPTAVQTAGAVAVLAGIYLVMRARRPRPARGG